MLDNINWTEMFQSHAARNDGYLMLNADPYKGQIDGDAWAQWRAWRISKGIGVNFMNLQWQRFGRWQVPSKYPEDFDTSWTRANVEPMRHGKAEYKTLEERQAVVVKFRPKKV